MVSTTVLGTVKRLISGIVKFVEIRFSSDNALRDTHADRHVTVIGTNKISDRSA